MGALRGSESPRRRRRLSFVGPSTFTVDAIVGDARRKAAVEGLDGGTRAGSILSRVLSGLGLFGRMAAVILAQVLLPSPWLHILRAGLVIGAAVPNPGRGKFVRTLPALVMLRSYIFASSWVAKAHSRSVDFWTRVIPIYVAYKYTQVVAPLMNDATQDRMWKKRHEWGAEAVYRLCVELRGFYLKDGQFIGSRADFIPAEWGEKLALLQDNVPPAKFEMIAKVLCSEAQVNSIYQVFKAIDKRPLASATIAQVHLGITRNAKSIVVKVQYDDQESLMELDLRNLRNLASFLQTHDMKFFDLLSVVSEFEAQIPLEFDFIEEASMMKTIGDNLRKVGICPAKVVIPEVEEDLVSRRVLGMDYIEGVRVDDTKTLNLWNVNREYLVRSLGEAYGQMILVDGIFHADPHPGNLLVLPDSRVAMLDFGQCKRLDETLRLKLCAFYLSICSKDPNAIAQTFRELGIVLDMPIEASQLRSNYLISIYANGLFDTGPLPDGIDINPFANSSPLREVPISEFPAELFMVLRTMGLLRALCCTVGCEVALSEVFRPFALTGLRRADRHSKEGIIIPSASTRPVLLQKTIMKISEMLTDPDSI
mmetsp:Transcript_38280/g.151448  ORF Transcript_38280/g.151448 Transcript_38280/m.151448 type:complete len:594 (-) Transcript_38280:754-2535(-)|eukprot:CAMPEP_0113965802 /NCGR_PEP_ID=MMETSP0011_2-20120614/7959_1 /TAXON_ID=101924 /ORGANISM="Rhodosorus marinus" /LENGTH=593 /DNA_ID=CAMNT_0000978379 /DNA_START=170 /DNA_END=1951 /DNA_ORIENTATION=- /assembly_acc=CAM_ASM_000156